MGYSDGSIPNFTDYKFLSPEDKALTYKCTKLSQLKNLQPFLTDFKAICWLKNGCIVVQPH